MRRHAQDARATRTIRSTIKITSTSGRTRLESPKTLTVGGLSRRPVPLRAQIPDPARGEPPTEREAASAARAKQFGKRGVRGGERRSYRRLVNPLARFELAVRPSRSTRQFPLSRLYPQPDRSKPPSLGLRR